MDQILAGGRTYYKNMVTINLTCCISLREMKFGPSDSGCGSAVLDVPEAACLGSIQRSSTIRSEPHTRSLVFGEFVPEECQFRVGRR